jgi:endonuclease/exonuclease/phosphatase family metal-dependent hydrolase
VIRLSKREFCILATLLVILSGCGSYGHISRSVKHSRPQNGLVKVMTFNIRTKTIIDGPNHWNHRKQIVYDVLADNAADVIGLQEAKTSQLRQIRQALPSYGVYSAGRNDGVAGGESCPILYRKSRFFLAEAGTFWFSDTPSVPGTKDWGNLPPRICSWARLIEKSTGSGFYVYNLHLDNLSQNSRAKSTRLLTQKIARRRTSDPFMIMGDFNMVRNNPAMNHLKIARAGFLQTITRDVWQLIHPGRSIGTRHGFRGSFSGPQIDHIRICNNMRALDARIDHRHVNGRYPSDHFPIIAQVLIGRISGSQYTRATLQNTPTRIVKQDLPDV